MFLNWTLAKNHLLFIKVIFFFIKGVSQKNTASLFNNQSLWCNKISDTFQLILLGMLVDLARVPPTWFAQSVNSQELSEPPCLIYRPTIAALWLTGDFPLYCYVCMFFEQFFSWGSDGARMCSLLLFVLSLSQVSFQYWSTLLVDIFHVL